MSAKLVIVAAAEASGTAPIRATASQLATCATACGLDAAIVPPPSAAQTPSWPEADAYLHVGLTPSAPATVMHARSQNRPVIVHAVGDEVETACSAWQTAPGTRFVLTSSTRLTAGSPRARQWLAPWHAQPVRLWPLLPVPGPGRPRQETDLPATGLLVGVFEPCSVSLLTWFSEVWDVRQDAWLLLAGGPMDAVTATAVAAWAQQDPQPARRVIWRPQGADVALCDQVWSLSAHGPTPAVLAALATGIPVVGTDAVGWTGAGLGDHHPFPTPGFVVPGDVAALTFAALSHAADPPLAAERAAVLHRHLTAVYRPAGLMSDVAACFAELGLAG